MTSSLKFHRTWQPGQPYPYHSQCVDILHDTAPYYCGLQSPSGTTRGVDLVRVHCFWSPDGLLVGLQVAYELTSAGGDTICEHVSPRPSKMADQEITSLVRTTFELDQGDALVGIETHTRLCSIPNYFTKRPQDVPIVCAMSFVTQRGRSVTFAPLGATDDATPTSMMSTSLLKKCQVIVGLKAMSPRNGCLIHQVGYYTDSDKTYSNHGTVVDSNPGEVFTKALLFCMPKHSDDDDNPGHVINSNWGTSQVSQILAFIDQTPGSAYFSDLGLYQRFWRTSGILGVHHSRLHFCSNGSHFTGVFGEYSTMYQENLPLDYFRTWRWKQEESLTGEVALNQSVFLRHEEFIMSVCPHFNHRPDQNDHSGLIQQIMVATTSRTIILDATAESRRVERRHSPEEEEQFKRRSKSQRVLAIAGTFHKGTLRGIGYIRENKNWWPYVKLWILLRRLVETNRAVLREEEAQRESYDTKSATIVAEDKKKKNILFRSSLKLWPRRNRNVVDTSTSVVHALTKKERELVRFVVTESSPEIFRIILSYLVPI